MGGFNGINMQDFKNMDYDNISNYGERMNIQYKTEDTPLSIKGMTRNISNKSISSNQTNLTANTKKNHQKSKTLASTMPVTTPQGPNASLLDSNNQFLAQFSKSQNISSMVLDNKASPPNKQLFGRKTSIGMQKPPKGIKKASFASGQHIPTETSSISRSTIEQDQHAGQMNSNFEIMQYYSDVKINPLHGQHIPMLKLDTEFHSQNLMNFQNIKPMMMSQTPNKPISVISRESNFQNDSSKIFNMRQNLQTSLNARTSSNSMTSEISTKQSQYTSQHSPGDNKNNYLNPFSERKIAFSNRSKSPDNRKSTDKPSNNSPIKHKRSNTEMSDQSDGRVFQENKYSIKNFELTSKALQIMETRPNHQTFPQKFHPQLMKILDGKDKHLSSLDFSNSEIGDLGVHYLAYYIANIKSVNQLKLNNCDMSNDGLAILCKSMLKFNVDILYLNQNKIGMKGLLILRNCVIFKLKNASMRNGGKNVIGSEIGDGGIGLKLVSLKGNEVQKDEATKIIKEFGQMGVTILI